MSKNKKNFCNRQGNGIRIEKKGKNKEAERRNWRNEEKNEGNKKRFKREELGHEYQDLNYI